MVVGRLCFEILCFCQHLTRVNLNGAVGAVIAPHTFGAGVLEIWNSVAADLG